MEAVAENLTKTFLPPDGINRLRACLGCRIILTREQFVRDGCPCCADRIKMKENDGRVAACTTTNFQGFIAMMRPGAFVSRFVGLDKRNPGLYAMQVTGEIPDSILYEDEEDREDDDGLNTPAGITPRGPAASFTPQDGNAEVPAGNTPSSCTPLMTPGGTSTQLTPKQGVAAGGSTPKTGKPKASPQPKMVKPKKEPAPKKEKVVKPKAAPKRVIKDTDSSDGEGSTSKRSRSGSVQDNPTGAARGPQTQLEKALAAALADTDTESDAGGARGARPAGGPDAQRTTLLEDEPGEFS